jgi:tRNA-splicing ligase RtcB (3'-phosphate/5'-hydroxy nucleic acid ligase)
MKSTDRTLALWRSWSNGFETAEIRSAIHRMRQWPGAIRVVTLPDLHLAGKTCNGAVLATHEWIYPAAIGADIGCGMSALPLKTNSDIEGDEPLRVAILRSWRERIPILKTSTPNRSKLKEAADLSTPNLRTAAERDGAYQLGTLGRGNHFLELQVDEEGGYWLLVHSGSRAMGQAVTAHHESQATKVRGVFALPSNTPQGRAYRSDLAWCRSYASANRKLLLQQAAALLAQFIDVDADPGDIRETDHNHLQSAGDLLIHRKGAQGITKGAWGVIPGSMATATYHIEGRGCEDALDSCSHGAGRQLTRTQAKQSLSSREVHNSLSQVTCDRSQLTQIVDEAPAVYRDIEAVLRAQRDLVKRTKKLRPLLTLKGGR